MKGQDLVDGVEEKIREKNIEMFRRHLEEAVERVAESKITLKRHEEYLEKLKGNTLEEFIESKRRRI